MYNRRERRNLEKQAMSNFGEFVKNIHTNLQTIYLYTLVNDFKFDSTKVNKLTDKCNELMFKVNSGETSFEDLVAEMLKKLEEKEKAKEEKKKKKVKKDEDNSK